MSNANFPSTDIDKVLFAISEQTRNVNSIVGVIKGISDKVDNIDRNFNSYKKETNKRFDQIENQEEITYKQQNAIDAAVSKTVYGLLGIGSNPEKWSVEERTINAKYGKLFRKRLRMEVSNKGHLAYPYRTTQKGNFVNAINDIEAWVPRNGITGLMKEADDNALARKIAREQGY